MRRTLFAVGLALVAGCGIGVVGQADPSIVTPVEEAGSIYNPPPDGAPFDTGTPIVDADVDAESLRPDAGVLFVPPHIGPTSYVLTGADTTIDGADTHWILDTTMLTIRKGTNATPAPATTDPAFVADGSIAVWSVGALTISNSATLEVVGSRSLAIVAAKTVTITTSGKLVGNAKGRLAGPGGNVLSGAGVAGAPVDKGGGGGGGAGENGANGSTPTTDGAGGAGGTKTNADGALLVGGAAGGSNGAAACVASSKGSGGGGGGAIQITSLLAMKIDNSGHIQALGGGAEGGCTSPAPSGGGGGGAGGLVFLETASTLAFDSGAYVDARGGGGGEGANSGQDGDRGEDPDPNPGNHSPAIGGDMAGGGGNGGAGGTSTTAPKQGDRATSSGGGGGGAAGTLIVRARGTVMYGGGVNFDGVFKVDTSPF